MDAKCVLSNAVSQGIVLYVEDGSLKYRAKKGKLSAQLKKQLKDNKNEIVAYLSQFEQNQQVAALPNIEKSSQSDNIPLSYAQQSLWFIDQFEDGSQQFNMTGRLLLEGRIQESVFKQTLKKMIERHQVLRTCFQTELGEVYQRVISEFELPYQGYDLSESDEQQAITKVQALMRQEASTAFDLSTDLMIRVKLIKLSQTRQLMLYTIHHIASDGWSMAIFNREFNQLYKALSKGQADPLTTLEICYRDYTLWQRRLLNESTLAQSLQYWQRQLAGITALHRLPVDAARPARQSFNVRTHRQKLSATLTKDLNALSHRQQTTLFITLQSAFSLLLSRFSCQQDIVMGTPVSGRTHSDIEPLMGLFLNSLVLRTRLTEGLTFNSLLQTNKTMILDAFSHQQLPFEKLVESLNPQRSLAYSPIFQIWFVLQNNDKVDLTLVGNETTQVNLAAEPEAHIEQSGNYELSLYLRESEHGLNCTWRYNETLFNDDTIAYLAAQFNILLNEVVSEPDKPVKNYRIFSASTLMASQPAAGSVTSARKEATSQSVIEQFSMQVARYPHNLAVVDASMQMSYRELDELSSCYANGILTECEGEKIALLFDHQALMVVAILAALKAGKTYVPLDAQYPSQRLAYIVKDAGISSLLYSPSYIDLAETLADCSEGLQLLSIEHSSLNQNPVEPQCFVVNPIAYILYTSGSTGQPKGVYQAQSHLMHFANIYAESVSMTANDRVLQLASFNFDASIMDVFAALLHGASLHLLDIKSNSSQELISCMRTREITLYHSTPTVLKHIHEAETDQQIPSVRAVVLGGEAIDGTTVAAYLARFTPQSFLINGFGPTESTLALQHKLAYAQVKKERLPTLGVSVRGVEVTVVNEQGTQADVYEEGEIVITSAYLALGYWGQEALSKEKFQSLPDGRKAFRTGDCGRLLASGQIQHLGRNDEQVKLRGIRIELLEVESQLSAFNGVKSAAVVICPDSRGEDCLVAYIVLQQSQAEHQTCIALLKEHLRQCLPDYMVPEYYIFIDALAYTPSGKVDRTALPEFTGSGDGGQQDYVEPDNDIELALVQTWQQLLRIDGIGRHHNFFALGGHSLLATRLISAIREQHQVEIPLRVLFESPTIAELGQLILEYASDKKKVLIPPITRADRQQSLPLSYAQQRLWFVHQLDGDSSQYNMPGRFSIFTELDVNAFEAALRVLIERHEVLRTHYLLDNSEARQVIQEKFSLPLQHHDLSHLDEVEQAEQLNYHFEQECNIAFNLKQDLMLRIRLLTLSPCRHICMYTLHHIASDAWSIEVLRNELKALYQAFAIDGQNPLPPLPVQYVDYSLWQRNWLQGQRLTEGLNYWLEQLKGIPLLHDLPLDYPRSSQQSYTGKRYHYCIDSALSSKLKVLCNANDVTLFMFLHTAFTVLLSRYSHETDILVGSPIAGRTRAELEPLIGFFVNTLILRTDLSGNPSFSDLLQRNKETILNAYAHQHIPFEMLVDELNPERYLSHNPVTQIYFVLQNSERSSFESAENNGVDSAASRAHGSVSSMRIHDDLVLTVIEQGDELLLGWAYNTALFADASVARMAENYATLLDDIVTKLGGELNAEPGIRQLTLVAEPQRHNLLVEWNSTERVFPQKYGVHELFEKQAASTPDAIALTYRDHVVSYAEINRRANQLAHYLLKKGLLSESRIGLCVERRIEMVIGMLGILKAGGCYVPLDPEYPSSRLEYMLTQSSCLMVLTETHLLESLTFLSQVKTLPLDPDVHELLLGNCSKANIGRTRNAVCADSLAYVIYTSGSTGEPKGVTISHANITSLVATDNAVALTKQDIIGQLSNHSFDAITYELWGGLLSGSRVIIIDKDTFLSPELLHRSLIEHCISTVFITTALFNRIAKASAKSFAQMDKVLFGGEAFSAPAITAALQAKPNHLLHVYGPTECTTFATSYELDNATFSLSQNAPIGAPLANNTAYVLSDYGLSPIGVAGELCIGGQGVSRGYLGRAGLTAEKFIPNPFSKIKGERLYCTGDLVRYRACGNMDFVGRTDHQVKVRGFRIELSEIENVLRQHPDIRESVVIAHQDSQGYKRLVAYLVYQQDSKDEANALQTDVIEHLKSHLPDYMLPSTFVSLAAIPLTPNKKVDKTALPAPDESAFASAQYCAPETETERKLVKLWQDNLSHDKVGTEDNYFAIGGDSIRSISLVAEAKKQGLYFSVKELFANATIAELAREIEQSDREAPEVEYISPFSLLSEDDKCLTMQAFELDSIEDIYPMSMLQQGMVFHSLHNQGSAVYNDILAYHFKLDWNEQTFAQALNHVISRHAMLRTQFYLEGENALQVVFKHKTASFELRDLIEHNAQSQQQILSDWLQETKRSNLDISTFPWHISIYRLSDQEIFFGMHFHHALWDGWSNASLISELLDTYNQFKAQGHGRFATQPPAYKYFISLEQKALSSPLNLSYWQNKLADAHLPWWSSRIPEARNSFSYPVSENSSRAIIALAGSLGVQEKSVWTAVYLMLLSLLDGADDIIGSVVMHGRPEMAGSEKTLGLFLNTLPIRMNVGAMSWASLIRKVDNELKTLYSMRHFPLFKIQLDSGLDFSASMINFTHFHVYEENDADAQILSKGGHEENNYCLSFQVSKEPQALRHRLYLTLDTATFDTTCQDRMKVYIDNMLEQLACAPDKSIEKSSLIGQREVQCLLTEWNDTQADYPIGQGIHQLVEQQTKKRPDAVAVMSNWQQLSYAQLDHSANLLAHRLLAHGVKPGQGVGLYVDRDLKVLVAMLAVLKTGGYFVPLDPGQPVDRLEYIIKDSGIRLILTTRSQLERPNFCLQRCIDNLTGDASGCCLIDPEDQLPTTQGLTDLCAKQTHEPGKLAYLIYTSGSTGAPKGVRICHANVINFLTSMAKEPGIDCHDRLLAVTTFAFDIAMLELFLPLISGACVDIADDERVKNGELLVDRVNNNGITMLQATPVTWQILLECGWQGSAGLKALVGGEALSPALAEEVLTKVSSLWNLYGPTESTIWSCLYQVCGLSMSHVSGSVAIGRPINNTGAYVLDNQKNLCPIGVVGELYLAGAGLAQGYHRQTGLTAERFVPHPYSSSGGERLYRTGDMVRYLEQGMIEFIGRADHQVKLRGFRIELGEIETRLLCIEGVKQAAVLLHEDDNHNKRLVVYIVLHEADFTHITQALEHELTEQYLRYLSAELPEYMLPECFMFLAELPLTANGKLDRRALPEPRQVEANWVDYIAPRNVVEETLCELFEQVLKRPKVGIEEDFFTLGGHSLMATRLINLMRKAFDLDIPMRVIFTQRTVRRISAELMDDIGVQVTPISSSEDLEEVEL